MKNPLGKKKEKKKVPWQYRDGLIHSRGFSRKIRGNKIVFMFLVLVYKLTQLITPDIVPKLVIQYIKYFYDVFCYQFLVHYRVKSKFMHAQAS